MQNRKYSRCLKLLCDGRTAGAGRPCALCLLHIFRYTSLFVVSKWNLHQNNSARARTGSWVVIITSNSKSLETAWRHCQKYQRKFLILTKANYLQSKCIPMNSLCLQKAESKPVLVCSVRVCWKCELFICLCWFIDFLRIWVILLLKPLSRTNTTHNWIHFLWEHSALC